MSTILGVLLSFLLQFIALDLYDYYLTRKRQREVAAAQEQLKRYFELEDQLMRQKYDWWDDVMGVKRNERSSD